MTGIRIEQDTLRRLRTFAGDIEAEQLRYVDTFMALDVALFMPVAGPCLMAVSAFHTHPCPLFVINFTDSTSIVLPNKKLRAQANSVTYVPAWLPHHEVNDAEIPRYVAILVRPGFLDEQAKVYASGQPDWSQPITFRLSDELLSVVKRFMAESKSLREGSEKVLEAYSVEVVHQLLRSMLGIKAKRCLQVSRIEINRSIEYMRQNLSEKLTLDSLACLAGMSVSQYTRVFRQETGLSPIDFLIEMRLEVASRLIQAGSLPFKRIAMECGFSSPAHFSSSFQKKFRMSPSEYLNLAVCRPTSA